MKETKITDELVREYLKGGFHVHIRTPDDKGNKRIVETMLLTAIPTYQLKDSFCVRFGVSNRSNVPVVSRTFLSPRDVSNHRVPNKVVVGRIVRLVLDGLGQPNNIFLCDNRGMFQDWLVAPTIDDSGGRGIKKIAILSYPGVDIVRIRKDILKYRDCMEGRTEDGS